MRVQHEYYPLDQVAAYLERDLFESHLLLVALEEMQRGELPPPAVTFDDAGRVCGVLTAGPRHVLAAESIGAAEPLLALLEPGLRRLTVPYWLGGAVESRHAVQGRWPFDIHGMKSPRELRPEPTDAVEPMDQERVLRLARDPALRERIERVSVESWQTGVWYGVI